MKFEHLFSPMQVGKVTYRNRIVSAPMAFGLIVQNPDARDFTYRKLEASAKGGNGCVIVGETDVNFTDAVRIPGFRPFDFTKPEEDPETFDAVGEYARRIKRHGAVALAELVHCGKEKVPFGPGQEAIGPIETTNLAGVRVRPMNEDDMARIARDFAVSATYMQKAGFDGVLIHGGHGFLFTQFLSPLMNTRTDSYGGSLENRARFPLQILKAVREAVGPDFLVELRIDGTDHQPGGITPEETGAFVAMAEPYITSVHVTCGIYEASVKSGTESSMFHPHGLNIDNAAIIKTYTKLPVGAVGGINSPELCEQAIAEGKIDFAILGRQMLADPEFANKARSGHEDQIRRCLRCYKCFPGSPEEGYDDLPFTSEELALYVGHCTINPLAHLPFDPDTLAPASKQETVLIVGGGAAGMQAAITACDRGQKVILAEQGPCLGGLLRFTDVDTDKPDLMNFKNLLVREVERRDIDVRLNTVITPENITSFGADGVIFATGSLPSSPGARHRARPQGHGHVRRQCQARPQDCYGGRRPGGLRGRPLPPEDRPRGHRGGAAGPAGQRVLRHVPGGPDLGDGEMRHGHAAQDPLPGDHPHRREGGKRRRRPDPGGRHRTLCPGHEERGHRPPEGRRRGRRTQDLGHRRRHPARQGGSGHPQRLSGRHRGGPLSPPPRNKSTPPAKPEGFCLSEKRQEPLFRGRCAQDEP